MAKKVEHSKVERTTNRIRRGAPCIWCSQLQKGNLLAFVNHAFCICIAGNAHKFSTTCVCMPCAMAYTVNEIIDILDHKRNIKLQNLCVFVNVIALYMSSDQRKKRTSTILAVHCLSILSSSCRTQKIRPFNDGRKQSAFCPACALVRGSDFQAYGKYTYNNCIAKH